MAKDYDHKKYGSVMKGRSAEQLDAYRRDFGSKKKALEKKTGTSTLKKLKKEYPEESTRAIKNNLSYYKD